MKHNWEYKTLCEVCKLSAGGDKPAETSKEKTLTNMIPVYSNGIENDGLYGYCSKAKVFNNALTISGRGTIGYPSIKREPFVPIIRLIVAEPNDNIKLDYLYYWVYNRRFSGNGAAIPQLTVPMIKNEIIPVPSMEVQEQIVEELDKINEIISDCKEAIRNLDSLAQSLFYDYFGDPITNPKGWEVCKLGDKFDTGSGGTPSKTVNEYWENGDIPWIGSNMCQNKIITKTDGKFITSLGLENSSAKVLEPNTVLVALVGATIGKAGLLQIPASTNQNIGFIKPNPTIAFPLYLFFVIKNLYSLFTNIGNGKFKMANLSFIRNLPIILPPLSLQEKFASRLEQIEQQKKGLEGMIANMQTLLDNRMDYWFG